MGNVEKVYVDGVSVSIVAERVEYLDEDGKLVTESLRDFTRKALRKHYAGLDDFLRRWKGAERKQRCYRSLLRKGCRSNRWLRNWAKTSIRST